MKNKFFCIHAHFDLPPRENPWLDTVEASPSAAPYRDDMERMLHDCCGPNSASPLLDAEGRILKFINNYAFLSFDFGPRRLDWLERGHPRVYARILEADLLSRREHGGHGCALASAFPSPILPLESERDKRTVIRWGIRDFTRRFGRAPEGFWLPENAADGETLDILIDEGIRFTLLSPAQASHVRPADSRSEKDWLDTSPETLDTTRPYRWNSPRGEDRRLAVFFYRQDLSPARIYEKLPFAVSTKTPHKTSREQVLEVGQRFANRLVDSFTANDAVELSHIAVDGELFGHLRLNGNRALTYALDILEREAPARRTNYGEYLDLFPPPQEVRLHPLSSRSCPHGVQRWSGDCGCEELPPAKHWRKPLREALDALGRELDERFLELGSPLFWNTAEARDAFSPLPAEPGAAVTAAFLDAQTSKHLTPDETRRALRLCEMQRWRLRMMEHWTWQEEDPTAPSGLHALACACKALDVLALVDDRREEVEKRFIEDLSRCPSGGTAGPNAAEAYNKLIRPTRVDLRRALVHFAISDHLGTGPMPCAGFSPSGRWDAAAFDAAVEPVARRTRRAGRDMHSLSLCRVRVRQSRTFERTAALTAVFHSGGAEIECWTLENAGEERLHDTAAKLERAFLAQAPAAFRESARRLFEADPLTLDALFPGARRRVVLRVIPRGPSERREFLLAWYEGLRRFHADPRRAPELTRRLAEAEKFGIAADSLPDIEMFRDAVREAARAFADTSSAASLDRLILLLDTAERTGLHLPLWDIQHAAWEGLGRLRVGKEDEEVVRWFVGVLGISEALFARPAETTEA